MNGINVVEQKQYKNEICCGIDFGTSNSVISITDANTFKEIYSFSDKSILYYRSEERRVGKEC